MRCIQLLLFFLVSGLMIAAVPGISFARNAVPAYEARGEARGEAQEGASFSRVLNSQYLAGVRLVDVPALRAFYAQRNGQPFWGGQDDAMIEAAEDSWEHGLNPERYHLARIDELESDDSLLAQAARDLLLTDAFVRYAQDLSGARINPASLGLDPSDWLRPYDARTALGFLSEKRRVSSILEELPPQGKTYKALQRELVRLSREPEEPYAHVLPIRLGGKTLYPAQRHERVPALRVRLNVRPQTSDELLYDDRLAAAVIKFQKQSGLQPDGIIGPTTLRLLNRTNAQRMLQVIANLERLRWMSEERPERFVMVNIPAATLWAVEDGRVDFEMPVIVGKRGRETPSFITDITGVRFNPGWTVPPTIKREDILPKLIEDPQYLTNKGMELIQATSEGPQIIDPVSVDWTQVSEAELGGFEMVQTPGAHNPLGRIRILMPNRFDIYLHDTNEPGYFTRQHRARSSGCIRMKEPEKMANFVMDGEPGWGAERLASLLEGSKTRDLLIQNPIPVYILYYTVWVGGNDEIIFGNDIYDMDPVLLEKLSEIDGIAFPVHN